ncbi:MAG: hypothetical protein QG641_927 [Candidatus Poribacteria bacterium]|nr:hypothetical protein [Candidatus Poribacteria bacterium]
MSQITIVEEGKSIATIVLASDIGQTAIEAVNDMIYVIEKMSGAKLPIVKDGDIEPENTQIHIGLTSSVKRQGLLDDSVSNLAVNGYHIYPFHQNLAIVANSPLGISHGIYDLLTNELGIVWGMADEIFEEIPKRSTVAINYIDRISKPSFGFRVFSGVDSKWIRRNRIDDGSRQLPFYGHGHNLFNVLPPSKYGGHPEYYAMRNGERKVPEEDGHTHIQPCLTNPDVIRITIKTVQQFFDENPQVSTYSLCPNDSADFCECPDCSALDEGVVAYRGRRMNSDSYFYYIDTVAKELLKSHPDRYVSAYAYWTTELPPRRIAKLPENVVIYLTQDSSQYYDATYEKRDHDILEKWSKAAHYLAVYDYYGLGWFTPRYFPKIVARTLPFLPTVEVKGFYCEAYPYWAHFGPQIYLASRLLWDTSTNANAVIDEWLQTMFKEASEEMRKYFEILECGWMEMKREGKWFLELDRLHIQLTEWSYDVRDKAWEQINVAYNSAKDDTVRKRVDYVRQGNRMAYLLSKTLEEAHAIKKDSSNPETKIRNILAHVEETLTLYHKKIESDMTLGSAYYRGERATKQLMWWKGYIGSIISDIIKDSPLLEQIFAKDDNILRDDLGYEFSGSS